MKKIIRILALFAVLLLSKSVVFCFVSVEPGVVELNLKPGQKYKGEFLVSNKRTNKVVVTLDIQEFWSKQTGQAGADPAKWLKVSYKKEFMLSPGQKKKISYKVTMPSDAKSESMAMLFFCSKDIAKGSAVSIEMRHGIPIYIVPREGSRLELNVKSLSAYIVNNSTTSKIEFSVDIANNGSIHTRPTGELDVFSADKQLETISLNSGWPVFPGKTQKYSAVTESGLIKEGSYRVEARINYGNNIASLSGNVSEEFLINVSSASITIKQ